ncbi:MAG: response regulator transcription factor [Proteobacteria bacterium]|nr:response regulator transcription factor [Pseudomonadota bacterium]
MSIRVLLAEDHAIVRHGLRALIEKEDGIEVVAEAGDGRTAVQLAVKHVPDVAVMDIGLPELNGIEATKRIISKVPSIKVITLSMHANRRYISQMLKVGARGYLLKDSAFVELITAIRKVMLGERFLGSKVADSVIDDYVAYVTKADLSAYSLLTSREREVLQLLAEGASTKDIATKLDVSVKTIETHRSHVMNKLNLFSIAELTRYAIEEGLTFLHP